jgi:hypothetical protein
MRDELHGVDILDLGAASELTLGEPEPLQFENVTIEDFWD